MLSGRLFSMHNFTNYIGIDIIRDSIYHSLKQEIICQENVLDQQFDSD